MATPNFYVLAKPLLPDQELEEQDCVATRQLSVARAKAEIEPEARLWKVCAEVAPPWHSAFEWITFLLLGAMALGAVVCCFYELFQLLNSGALEQTVRALCK